jgi:hypothetical protein
MAQMAGPDPIWTICPNCNTEILTTTEKPNSTLHSYEIKSPSWTILWFRSLGIFLVENIDRLGVCMFQT